MFREFKQFAVRGNWVDMAVGLTVGVAFGAIARSFVDDIIMPVTGLLIGRTDFSNLFIILQDGTPPSPYPSLAAAQEAGAVTLNYGLFANTVLTFAIVALVMFYVVRTLSRLREEFVARPEAADVQPDTRHCPYCLTTIALGATRCPACTSRLDRAAEPAEP